MGTTIRGSGSRNHSPAQEPFSRRAQLCDLVRIKLGGSQNWARSAPATLRLPRRTQMSQPQSFSLCHLRHSESVQIAEHASTLPSPSMTRILCLHFFVGLLRTSGDTTG